MGQQQPEEGGRAAHVGEASATGEPGVSALYALRAPLLGKGGMKLDALFRLGLAGIQSR